MNVVHISKYPDGGASWCAMRISNAIRNRVYNLHLIYNMYIAFKKARELYHAYIHYYHSIGDYSHDRLILDAAISRYVGYFGGLKKYFLR